MNPFLLSLGSAAVKKNYTQTIKSTDFEIGTTLSAGLVLSVML